MHRNSPTKGAELDCDDLTKGKTSRQIKEKHLDFIFTTSSLTDLLLLFKYRPYPLADKEALLYTLYIYKDMKR